MWYHFLERLFILLFINAVISSIGFYGTFLVSASLACDVCTCGLSGEVDCDRRLLDEIPSDIPTNTRFLFMSSNRFTIVKKDSFKNLKSLSFLSLDHNNIETIEQGAFNGLEELSQLWLHNNKITEIRDAFLSPLEKLDFLNLQNNEISTIARDAFSDLINLKTLRIFNNTITAEIDNYIIHRSGICGLIDLRTILWNHDDRNVIEEIDEVCSQPLPTCENIFCGEYGVCEDGICECNTGFTGTLCNVSPCVSMDCGPNGSCHLGICTCRNGYLGTLCTEEGPCVGVLCGDHGDCVDGVCDCKDLWTGNNCEVKPDYCENVHCGEDGSCDPDTGICVCKQFYYGSACQHAEACASIDCGVEFGRGNCSNATCHCVEAFMGDHCDILNPCAGIYCSGHGICAAGNCTCFTEEYSGSDCEIQNLCFEVNCGDHGSCNPDNGKCLCRDNYTGEFCEIPDPCEGIQCGEFGSCSEGICICRDNYRGDNCEIPDPCLIINCGDHGSCSFDGDCICRDFYRGTLCEIPNPCSVIDCGDHGECTQPDGFCECRDNYSGVFCEIPDPCENIDCGLRGDCFSGNCICRDNYSGVFCEIPDPCENIDCGSHGFCQMGLCICTDFYSGVNCELPDPCLIMDCNDSGDCVRQTPTEAKCICQVGLAGDHCDMDPLDACDICSCFSKNWVSCQNGDVGMLNLLFNPEIKYLFAISSNLYRVDAVNFLLTPEISTLDLSNNQITKLGRGAFAPLTKLKKLSIFNNPVAIVSNTTDIYEILIEVGLCGVASDAVILWDSSSIKVDNDIFQERCFEAMCIGIDCGLNGTCSKGVCQCRDGFWGSNCEKPCERKGRHFRLVTDGLCLDGRGYFLTAKPCDMNEITQQWFIMSSGLVVRASDGSCLSASPGPPRRWRSVRSIKCTGGLEQQWRLRDVGSDSAQLVSQQDGRCAIISSGGKIKMYRCWRKKQSEVRIYQGQLHNNISTACDVVERSISTVDDNCLDSYGYYIVYRPCSGVYSQQWVMNPYGMIMRASDGRCLDAGPPANQPRNWRHIRTAKCRGKTNQIWNITVDGDMILDQDNRCVVRSRDGRAKLFDCNHQLSQIKFLP